MALLVAANGLNYKDRSDIGSQKKRSEREQQPIQSRGSLLMLNVVSEERQ